MYTANITCSDWYVIRNRIIRKRSTFFRVLTANQMQCMRVPLRICNCSYTRKSKEQVGHSAVNQFCANVPKVERIHLLNILLSSQRVDGHSHWSTAIHSSTAIHKDSLNNKKRTYTQAQWALIFYFIYSILEST